jgi:hypothetical protein
MSAPSSGIVSLAVALIAGIVGYVGISKFIDLKRRKAETPHFGDAKPGSVPSLPYVSPPTTNGPWYSVLGVGPDASPATIQAAYDRLARQNATEDDHLLPPDLRSIVRARRAAIDHALQQARAAAQPGLWS